MDDRIIEKLVNSFDDFKERLIRIEENVKDVKSVKTDVEDLKIKYAALESKAASAHKRIDGVEDDAATNAEVKDLSNRVDKIERNLNKGVWIVLTVVIIGIMSLIVVTK